MAERSYTTFMEKNVEGKNGEVKIVYMEGFIRTLKDGSILNVKNVTRQDGTELLVATLNMSVVLGDKRAERMLGYVNQEYGSYFVRVSLFGMAAERIKKYDPEKNQIMGFFGELKVNTYESATGPKKSLELAATDFKVIKKKTGNEKGGSASEAVQQSGGGKYMPMDLDLPFAVD